MKRLIFFLTGLFLLIGVNGQSLMTSIVADQTLASTSSTLNNGLLDYYTFEEASGNAIDQKGSNDLTATNITYSQAGKVGNCFYYDSTAYLNGGHIIEPADSFSFSVWVKSDSPGSGTYRYIIDNYFGNDGYKLNIDDLSDLEINIRENTGPTNVSATKSGSYNDGAWHFIVATYDKVNLKLYIDNILEATTPITITITYSTDCYFHIGAHLTTYYFVGYIDDFGYWNRALTVSEISELYNGGNGKSYPF